MVTHCWRVHKLPMESISSSVVQAKLLLPSAKAPSSPNSLKAWLCLCQTCHASCSELCFERLWQKAAGNGYFTAERCLLGIADQTLNEADLC